jgi:hypothetical protein
MVNPISRLLCDDVNERSDDSGIELSLHFSSFQFDHILKAQQVGEEKLLAFKMITLCHLLILNILVILCC